MKNTFGNSVAVTIFGESHGPEIGVVVDGLAPGIPVEEDFINHRLALRRPAGQISTARVEPDPWRIVSGVFDGKTTGTPLTILIPNTNTKSKDYSATRFLPRPGHADYTANQKYHGFEDYRGGGHFSGRVTAGIVAAGAIAMTALSGKGILVGSHVARLGGIDDRSFADPEKEIERLNSLPFAVLDETAGEKMQKAILDARERLDSVGGILETMITGMPAGVGEPWFDSMESLLAHALFAVPGVKGVEFGTGFAMADMTGSTANDPFRVEAGRVVTATNHNGGINGGITNGMPILIRTAVKPTPSIFREQDTVDLKTNQNATLALAGRHDPAIVHRVRAVADSVVALTLCDLLAMRFGTDWLRKD